MLRERGFGWMRSFPPNGTCCSQPWGFFSVQKFYPFYKRINTSFSILIGLHFLLFWWWFVWFYMNESLFWVITNESWLIFIPGKWLLIDIFWWEKTREDDQTSARDNNLLKDSSCLSLLRFDGSQSHELCPDKDILHVMTSNVDSKGPKSSFILQMKEKVFSGYKRCQALGATRYKKWVLVESYVAVGLRFHKYRFFSITRTNECSSDRGMKGGKERFYA